MATASAELATWVDVAASEDIPEGEARPFTAGDERVAICRAEGNLYAVQDLCSHDDGPLGEGQLEDFWIECPRHGARFDVRDGSVASMPAIVPIGTFEVREQGGRVQVAVATAAAARTDDDW